MAATIRGRARPSTDPKPQADAYVGMMLLALLALITGSVFLWLEYDQYSKPLPKVNDRPAPVAPSQPQPAPPKGM